MNIRHSATIALCLVAIFSTNVIAEEITIYRWVDENNVVHFSQHEPKGTNYSQLTTVASYKARQKALPEQAKLPSVDEQLSEYEKKQAEIAAKNKEIAEKNCQAAQLNIKTLNSFDTVMITDPDGKDRALTQKERKAQLELSKKHIEMYCVKEAPQENNNK